MAASTNGRQSARTRTLEALSDDPLPESEVGIQYQNLNEVIDRERSKWLECQETPVADLRKYAKGDVQLCLTEEQQEILEGLLGHKFCHNICEVILGDILNRLELLGLDCLSETETKWLADWFALAQLDTISNDAHYAMLRDRNSCIALEWDEKRNMPVPYVEEWWDGNEGIFVAYDGQKRVKYAVKEWVEDASKDVPIKRRNVWLPGLLFRYRGQVGSWEPFMLETDGGQWPVKRLDLDNTLASIPVIHFANKATDSDLYGRSELDGGVLGFQDQINDIHWDESAAGRMTGFQMLWGTGIELDDDPNGEPGDKLQPAVGPGQFITSDKAEARFGTFPPGDISQLINLKQDKLKDVSHMTSTPMHVISGGDWPSGEALYRAEMPAVNKAAAKIKRLRNKWVEVAHRAMEMFNRHSKPIKTASLEHVRLKEDIKTAMLTARFAPPDRRDPLSRSVVVQTLGPIISEEEGLRIMGYTETDIERIQKEKESAVARQQEQLKAAFDAGLVPGANVGGGNPDTTKKPATKTPKPATVKATKPKTPVAPTSSNTKRT